MLFTLPALEPYQPPLIAIIRPAIEEPPAPPQPINYTVQKGDTLTSVAVAHSVSIERIWSANSQITNPDVLNVSEVLKIPLADEVLPDRPFPVIIQSTVSQNTGLQTSPPSGGFSASGNTYGNDMTPGFCTWHVKNLRPDLPRGLGNADTWYYRAQAMGLPTGTTPQVGAVAQTRGRMHVSYVTAVNGDTVTLSEMNYVAFNVVSTRTAPASEFLYIY